MQTVTLENIYHTIFSHGYCAWAAKQIASWSNKKILCCPLSDAYDTRSLNTSFACKTHWGQDKMATSFTANSFNFNKNFTEDFFFFFLRAELATAGWQYAIIGSDNGLVPKRINIYNISDKHNMWMMNMIWFIIYKDHMLFLYIYIIHQQFHSTEKTISRPSYLHYGNVCTDMLISSYWKAPAVLSLQPDLDHITDTCIWCPPNV